jgi:hypothetical protein
VTGKKSGYSFFIAQIVATLVILKCARMKNLLEIAKIVTRKRVNKIEIFDANTMRNKKSKFNQFYDALLKNKLKNDRDAASYLYKSTPTDAKYRQLKSRFKKRLLNTLFFLDINTPNAPNYERAYFSCHKDWVLIKILMANNADHTAESMARQMLTTALKFKFSDIIINAARILRSYAAKADDQKQFEQYNDLIQEYKEIVNAEIRSEELYQQVLMAYQQSSRDLPDYLQDVQNYANLLMSLSDIYDSPIISYHVYMVWIMQFELNHDYESLLELCEQASKNLLNNPKFQREEQQIQFFIKQMSAYLHLRNYRQGKDSAEQCLRILTDRNQNWFIFMEYYLLLVFHTENYIQAAAILKRTKGESSFKKLDHSTREKWFLFEAYLNYIIEVPQKNNPVLRTQRSRSFKVQQFINLPATFPRAYRNYNILLLILQTLFLIDKKSHVLANEKLDQLKTLTSKRQKTEQYFRARQFVKLLQQLSKADFQSSEVRNTDKYYERLIQTPFFYRGLVSELEIIPYEMLWQMVLQQQKSP